jgi:hypothetical protein
MLNIPAMDNNFAHQNEVWYADLQYASLARKVPGIRDYDSHFPLTTPSWPRKHSWIPSPTSPTLHDIRTLGDVRAATVIGLQVASPTQPLPSSGEVSTAQRKRAMIVVSNGRAQFEADVTIVVGLPVDPEQREIVEIVVSDSEDPEDRTRSEYTAARIDAPN